MHRLLPLDHLCKGTEQPLGFRWLHPHRVTGEPCDGVVSVCTEHKVKGEVWRLEQNKGAVTLSPSLLCEKCGEHGFVTEGYWEGVP